MGRILILIPGTLNHFYNLAGRRVAEAVAELGLEAEVGTLTTHGDGNYDLVMVMNISEVILSSGNNVEGLARLYELRRQHGKMVACSLDSVCTPWFEQTCRYCEEVGIETILDLGLYDQVELVVKSRRYLYHFVFCGLTQSERNRLNQVMRHAEVQERPIPWAFIGHGTPERIALVDYFSQTISYDGFVYMPALVPYTESNSPHLNQEAVEKVLSRTQYQIWCSHHAYFYMEPERFRASLLTGGLPIKVVRNSKRVPTDVPFRYLIMEEGSIARLRSDTAFRRVRRRFWREFDECKTLAVALGEYLAVVGLLEEDPAAVLGTSRQWKHEDLARAA